MQEQLQLAIQGGNIPLVVSVVLPGLVAFLAMILQGNVASRTYKTMSLVRAVVAAGCSGMAGAALVNPDSWWMGLSVAIFGLWSSQTFIDEARSLISDWKKR